ncbi:MAG: hypothetical protein ABI422_06960 [Sphingomicrobium sp.]
MTETTFDYSVFGLHIRSDLALPELLGADPQSEPQVFVRIGDVPAAAASSSGLQPIEGGVVLTVDDIARYAITGGSRITIDRQANVPDVNVRLYLLGSAMGVLLHQRGVLPLHANAVEIGSRAFAFMGASGAGKSTLAVWFHEHGYRVLADDVCAVNFGADDTPLVTPGLPRLRLWKEALEGTGRQAADFSRSYAGDDSYDKYDVPIAHGAAVPASVEIAGIYVLGKGDSFSIRPLKGLEAAEAVFANTYRGTYVPAAGNVRGHWESCVKLVGSTPIFQLSRAWDLSRISGEIQEIVAHATQIASQSRPEHPSP